VFFVRKRITISIPKELYDEIAKEIKGTGFSSPSEWIRYVLRQAIASAKNGDKSIISFPYLAGN